MTLSLWQRLARPPETAIKAIQAGRLRGKSDINPQWRFQAVTEAFGPVGTGWTYTIDRLWLEPGSPPEVCAFALVSVRYKKDGEWSEPFPGIGGSSFVTQEKSGPYTSDEAYKMAVTDALSVAFKALGVAADIYLGNWDGSKYRNDAPSPSPAITTKQLAELESLASEVNADIKAFCAYLKIPALSALPADRFQSAVAALEKKRRMA